MGESYRIAENGIHLWIDVTNEGDVRLLHCSAAPFPAEAPARPEAYRLVELQAAGEDLDDHHGSKYTGTLPAGRLRFAALRDTQNPTGRLIEVEQTDPATGLAVTSRLQFYAGLPVVQADTLVENRGGAAVGITYVSSFALTGLTKASLAGWDEAARVKIPHNTWVGEFQWKDYTLPALGLSRVFDYTTKRLSVSSTGSWTSHEHLPMGWVENAHSGEGWMFSLLAGGSWQWELADAAGQLALRLSGPTENESHWFLHLAPGARFTSEAAAVACTSGGFAAAVAALTAWRRARRRENEDNRALPVIFNDFMNCLSGDPTEEKLLPLIDAAADAGCEYFTIDAGWYAEGSWWSRVGEWQPAKSRFPRGLAPVLARIRERGMVPGLWLELEVVGIHSPLAESLPDEYFFLRHGRRVIDHGRYQLDFRNPAVRQFADDVVKRLVEVYGAGYIKMDYNINAGPGTEREADSFGDGLLGHTRAYLAWVGQVFARYPGLIIENCGSGGMRINDAMLGLHSIQSSSDQTDYLRYAAIACAAPTAVPPEQNAVWAYPKRDADEENAAFNMVNAMLMRIHQSGHLAQLAPPALAMVKQGIACYKQIRGHIPLSTPFWPLGLPAFSAAQTALGLQNEHCAYLAVWRTEGGDDVITLPLAALARPAARATLLYPAALPCRLALHTQAQTLEVALPQKAARLIRLEYTE